MRKENETLAGMVNEFLQRRGRDSVVIYFATQNPDGVVGKDAVCACYAYRVRIQPADILALIGGVLQALPPLEGPSEATDAGPN